MFTASEPAIRIVPFAPEHGKAFADLNLTWIERYFVVEPHDREQLHDPQTHILAAGGAIFIALSAAGEVVATCALVADATDPGMYELAKMAVADDFQGQGIGRRIGEAAISWARARGASRIWLESNRRLAPALGLYRRLGFMEVPHIPSPYARSDIRMELPLTGE